MNICETNTIKDFFSHSLGVTVTTREEYDSLFNLLKRLDPDITWRDGDDLYSYDGFQECRENTYIAYDNFGHGVLYGDVGYADVDVIDYDLFESIVDGQSLTFEEVLFGEESGCL